MADLRREIPVAMISYLSNFVAESSSILRIVVIIVVIAGLHLAVIAVRHLSVRFKSLATRSKLSKPRTIASLATSAIVFVLYFIAFGLILKEVGISLKAYLASASIMGLAIGFGSQGLVQDVVNGLTIVFSGLFNVGDMVEISGQSGIVRGFGMRFTVIENSLGARVYIPNRTITNVVRYPRGYVRGVADISLPGDPAIGKQAEERVTSIVQGIFEQLPGVLMAPPSVEGRVKTISGKEFLRIEFRTWPGRGSPVETALKQEIAYALRALDRNYQDWMVTVNYEVEKKLVTLSDD
jgi:small-conductance mechanosensitive channel